MLNDVSPLKQDTRGAEEQDAMHIVTRQEHCPEVEAVVSSRPDEGATALSYAGSRAQCRSSLTGRISVFQAVSEVRVAVVDALHAKWPQDWTFFPCLGNPHYCVSFVKVEELQAELDPS